MAVDGIAYRAAAWGEGAPVVLLHGFTGSAESWWGGAARALPSGRTVAPDLLGHGRTDAPQDSGRYAAAAQVADLHGLLGAIEPGPVALLGYSMGARLALAFAAAHPDRVACLVLEGGTAGIEDKGERAARRAADGALADRIERLGIARFVDDWERLPLWSSQASLPEAVRRGQRLRRFACSPAGLAGSLRGFGQGVQPPLWDAMPDLPMPVLAIAGELDAKYAALAERIASLAPRGEAAIVAGAGHAPHLERPERFRAAVERFLLGCGWAGVAAR